LSGKFDPPNALSKDTKKFIQQLKTPTNIQQRGKNNSYCDIGMATAYWKKKRERRNSSMFGRHIGIFKALTYGNISTPNEISNYFFKAGIPLKR